MISCSIESQTASGFSLLLALPSDLLLQCASFLSSDVVMLVLSNVCQHTRQTLTQSHHWIGDRWHSSSDLFISIRNSLTYASFHEPIRRVSHLHLDGDSSFIALGNDLTNLQSLCISNGDCCIRTSARMFDTETNQPHKRSASNCFNTLEKYDSLKSLCLTACRFRDGSSIFLFQHIRLPHSLHTLDLSNCALGNDIALIPSLHNLSHLSTLRLSGNSIGRAAVHMPSLPSNLRVLCLSGNRLDGHLCRMRPLPQDLETLCLYDNLIGEDDLSLELPPILKSLCLSSNPIGRAIQQFKFPHSLTNLELERCNLGRTQMELMGFTFPPNLLSLSLANNPGVFDDVSISRSVKFPVGLQQLSLSGCFQNSGALSSVFPVLIFPASLTHLDLSNNQLGSSAASMRSWPANLKRLSLSKCNIGAFLGRVPAWSFQLESLDLSFNSLNLYGGGIMIGATHRHIPLDLKPIPASLRSLDLSFNELGCGLSPFLSRFAKSLSSLWIDRDDLTVLRESHPTMFKSSAEHVGYCVYYHILNTLSVCVWDSPSNVDSCAVKCTRETCFNQ